VKTTLRILRKVLFKFLKGFFIFIVITAIGAAVVVQFSGDSNYKYQAHSELVVNDVTGLNPIRVAKVVKPKQTSEIIDAITQSTGPISIGGGRYSMGGQTAYEESLHIDMRSFKEVLRLDEGKKTITVQPGITWRDVQEYIDPYNLSVRIMQTYSNFTVGGSLSVNVHGRYIGEGPLIKSVESIKLVLANGRELVASRDVNSDLFYGAIGGYGGIGVITEATLSLTENVKIERKTTLMPVDEYKEYFFKKIRGDSNVVFHNGDLYPPDYKEVLEVSWYKTDKPLTHEERIIARNIEYNWGPKAAEFVANYDIGKSIRKNIIDPIYYSNERVVWRNWEASYDVAELEPESRTEKTYVLREYFIPVENFDSFIPVMKNIFNRNNANIINVSIRHAHPAPENYLSWARKEVFAFVVYYQQGTDQPSIENVKKWSIEMIDAVIEAGGTYYLPYQIFASNEQFAKAYPRSSEYFALKKKVDPEYRFRNALWKRYYPESAETLINKTEIIGYYRSEEQTFLTIPEWYLVFNPLEYADFLQGGNNPSDFPFMGSLDEYWTLYDRVLSIGDSYPADSSEYTTMLQVIGISTTVEFMYKALYENTIGRFTRWVADGKDTREDVIIASAHRAYSDLLFNEVWYVFDFWSWVEKVWSETSFFGDDFIRKTERKLFFTLEFGFKTFYARLIGYGAQAAYEPSESLIYMTAKVPGSVKASLPETVTIVAELSDISVLSIPRWGPFTKALPNLLKSGVEFMDISGNGQIAVTIVMPSDSTYKYMSANELFMSEFVSDSSQKRSVLVVPVSSLDELIIEAENNDHRVEHIYDY
jgi:FAD/FMN-containing dehydrogenase